MKRKAVSALLVVALVAMPTHSRAPEPVPDKNLLWLCGRAAFYIGVGATMILTICGRYKHWGEFPGDMTLPPDPNFPLPGPIGTNPVMASAHSPMTIADAIACIPIMATNPPMDTVASPPTPFTNFWQFTLQAGGRLDALTNLYQFSGWESAAGSVVQVADSAGQPVWSDYAVRASTGLVTNNLPVWIGDANEPQRFYKLLSQ